MSSPVFPTRLTGLQEMDERDAEFFGRVGQQGLLGAIAPDFDQRLGEFLRVHSAFLGAPTDREQKVRQAKAAVDADPWSQEARAALADAENEMNLERGENPYYNPEKMGQSVGLAGSPLRPVAPRVAGVSTASTAVTSANAGGGGAPAGQASGGQGPAPEPGKSTQGPPKLSRQDPIFPPPAAWPEYTPGPEAPGIKVIRDAQGRVISASNREGAQGEDFGHEDPNEPLDRRRQAFYGAVDAQDPRAQALFDQMAPVEQRLAQERFPGALLGQREQQRDLSRREQAGIRGVETGLEVDAMRMAQQQEMAKRLVLGEQSEQEWIDQRKRALAHEIGQFILRDPERLKPVQGQKPKDPMKLDPLEARRALDRATEMAQEQLRDQIYRALFPQSVRIQDRNEGDAESQFR